MEKAIITLFFLIITLLFFATLPQVVEESEKPSLPIVINTWFFRNATIKGKKTVKECFNKTVFNVKLFISCSVVFNLQSFNYILIVTQYYFVF